MNKNSNYEFDSKLFMQFQMFLAAQEQMKEDKKAAKRYRPKRREKGSGGVTRLSGNRRRPFMASVTADADPLYGNKKQIPLAYFYEKSQALKFLDLFLLERDNLVEKNTAYNYVLSVGGSIPKQHTDNVSFGPNPLVPLIEKAKKSKNDVPTVKELWDVVYKTEIMEMSKSTQTGYKYAFSGLERIQNLPINEVKLQHLQPIFDELREKGYSGSKMNQLKNIVNHIFNYAERYDMIEKNYAKFVKYKDGRTAEEKEEKKKVPFTKEQIKMLFSNDDSPAVQSILIMIYTGMRPSELLQLKPENIHLEERYMIGGIKTSNGIDRVIPIHECIVPYIEELPKLDILGSTYAMYVKNYFNKAKERFAFSCTAHSGRHTFASLANEYGLNEFLIKKIMGHSAKDLTKDVYTHVDTQRLIDEINKLPKLD